ncbi:MAG: helix-turn-helix domain-containing protein [Enterocloster clostridioformis]
MRRAFKPALCRPSGHPAQRALCLIRKKTPPRARLPACAKSSTILTNIIRKSFSCPTLPWKEDLSLTYLSHFFKEYLGIPFQEYLAKIRCEKARQLLLLTDFPLLDICMSCGFSDSKYFNSGFRRQHRLFPQGVPPKFPP